MDNKKHIFYEKIQCIYNNIAKKDINKFTKLFYIGKGKTSFENRKSYLSKKWIKPQDKTVYPRMLKSEYKKYPFSQLKIDGRAIFNSADEFLNIELELFCQKIKEYVHSIVQLDSYSDITYKYLYVFNIIGDNSQIDYYQIEYCDTISPNNIAITITPPQTKSFLNIEIYRGTIQWHTNKIVLTFQNKNDYISTIFNTDLINNRTKYLVGVGIGIADINQKTPIAKKVVLTKEKIEDYSELYLILNETEVISAKENCYKFEQDNRDFDLNHFKKYIKKIERLDNLFKNLSNEGKYYNSFYTHLAFKKFSAIGKIFQKIAKDHTYYVNYRKRVLDILINSYPHERYSHIYIVMPIYQDDNIFEHQSSKALTLQKNIKELSHKVKIEIIFVIKKCKDNFSYEFREFLSQVHKSISIYFTLQEDIQSEVNSIDFIFTNKKNFVVSKSLRVHNPVFNIYRQETTLVEYEAMYRKILNKSLNYQEFIEDKTALCKKHLSQKIG